MNSLRTQFDKALEHVSSDKRILLATHENPDGDGIASMLAFYWWLKGAGREAAAFIKGEVPEYLKFLPGAENLTADVPDGNYELLVGFDYADFKRTGLEEWANARTGLRIVTFDHHPPGRQRGEAQIVDPKAASTSVMVYRFFKHVGAEISPNMAACILCGIVVDTGGFIHVNADAEAFRIAGEMMLKGANLAKITRFIFGKKAPGALRLWGEAILRIHFDEASGLALSRVTADDLRRHGVGREALADFSGVLNTVAGSRAAAFLSQEPDEAEHIKGSLRSEEYKNVDVSKIASVFGGGGHKLASGFKIKGNWKDVVGRLIREARKISKDNTAP